MTYDSCSGPKLKGNRSSKYILMNSPFCLNMKIGIDLPNSLINCLQIPHGVITSSKSLEMAIALKLFSFCVTAEQIVVLSAQIEAPYKNC